MNTIGKLQRINPLPPGQYWIDVIDSAHQQSFAGWLFEHSLEVKVLVSEHFEALNWPDCSALNFEGDCWPSRDWIKFEVLKPVSWDAVTLGFPNLILPDEKIETSGDTATVPDFSDNCDIGCQAQRVAVAAAVVGASAVAIALAIKLS
jgi:hypothetical protein